MSVFYVSTTGNDSNPGTLLSPFLTVAHGLETMFAGDTLFLRAGTYETIDSSAIALPVGTSWANAPIIAAYLGESVQIIKLNLFDSYVQYMIFDGLIIDNGGTNNECVYIAGGANHIRVKSSEIRNSAGQGVLTTGAGSDFNEFIFCTVHNNGDTALEHGFYIDSSDNLIDGCDIRDHVGFGVHVYGDTLPSRNVVRNCAAHGNGASGILLSRGDANIAYNNVCYANLDGLSVRFSATGSKLYNNTSYGNSNYGIDVFGSTEDTHVKNNIIFNNPTTVFTDEVGLDETNNFITDPDFVNAAGDDFHLLAGSPAINYGLILGEFTTDAEGHPRRGPYDAGAYEFLLPSLIQTFVVT
jgi:parallel beta-helix repeat protein